MTGDSITHIARLWRWSGNDRAGNWFFLTIDGEAGEVLAATALMRRLELGERRGFGSLKATVQIGETRWRTSVFPEKGGQSWLLPVKAAVRRAEHIDEGDEIALRLEV